MRAMAFPPTWPEFNCSATIIWRLFAMPDDSSFTLRQIDQARGDLYAFHNDLDFTKVKIAQLPTRNEVWGAVMLGMLGGAVAAVTLIEAFARSAIGFRDAVHVSGSGGRAGEAPLCPQLGPHRPPQTLFQGHVRLVVSIANFAMNAWASIPSLSLQRRCTPSMESGSCRRAMNRPIWILMTQKALMQTDMRPMKV
jgi:hypothetical protein